MKTNWKSFNIRMPNELIPIYDFLQNELNFFLSDKSSRILLEQIDITQHKGNVWIEMRDLLKSRIENWGIHNKTWHSYILFENLRRELESKRVSTIIWEELEKNNFNINKELFTNLHKEKLYPTRSQIANIKRSNKKPEISTSGVFNLDYTISEKQFFRMKTNSICQIKISKKDWIDYEIILPSSIDHRFTGKIAKPRFIKRKSDNVYVGICSYEYKIEPIDKENTNILGVDIGKIKLFSAVSLTKDGHFSNEYINSKRLQNTQTKINNLYKEKQILIDKIDSYERLRLVDNSKYNIWLELRKNISQKIVNSKKSQAQLIAYEVTELAKQLKCKEIHIENLRWLNSQGGKWNHSEIHSKIEEKANMWGIKVKRVSAFNSSKEHPISKEIGEIQDRLVKFKHEKIDRDLLAAINLSIRSTTIKLKDKLNKKVHTKRTKTKSSKKQIKELVNKIKGNTQIVVFLPSVSDKTIMVNLETRPLNKVLPLNSLLVKYYKKYQF